MSPQYVTDLGRNVTGDVCDHCTQGLPTRRVSSTKLN